MPKILDNIEHRFSDELRLHIKDAARVDYCVGYFNLRGWNIVCREIDALSGAPVLEDGTTYTRYCRLLIGMTKTHKQELIEFFADPDDLKVDSDVAIRAKRKLAEELREQLQIGAPTQEDEEELQQLLTQLRAGKVVVRLFLKHQLHAKLYLSHTGDAVTPIFGLVGSSNFTFSGLTGQGELNVDVLEQDASLKLSKWFDDRWNDRWCIDITRELIEVLESSWARSEPIPPYHIYLKMAYHLSREARTGLAEFSVPEEFSEDLLQFQHAAVKIAAHHVIKRGGVLLGDVVGLGKTMSASAIAKTLEDDYGYRTLILCPKNLVSMWQGYVDRYNMRARVVSHSMILQTLPTLIRHQLVIVDESHNFRNSLNLTYRALRTYLEENDCKVILLSATPYNKTYNDLANQLKLFLPEDYDLGIVPQNYIDSIGGAAAFSHKHSGTSVRTINAFERSDFIDDWREVMKLFMVRRTRSFIKKHYTQVDQDFGRPYITFSDGTKSFFPDRIPKKVDFALNNEDSDDQYAALYAEDVVESINALQLPRYGLQLYLKPEKKRKPTDAERTIIDNLSRSGRGAIGFCRTGLYKRLESCGYSFMLSLSRHILRNHIFLYALQNSLKLPVSGNVLVDIDYLDTDEADELQAASLPDANAYYREAERCYRMFESQYASRFDWIRCDLFDAKRLASDLESDNNSLLTIMQKSGVWDASKDRKLDALLSLVASDHPDDKVLVFTQFADTAEYLHRELQQRGLTQVGLAVGGSDNIIDLVTSFSPKSNEAFALPPSQQIRVMVTTDVLSEGQNLQDAHIIVNFDLPWALVRLIQRAGRVDRLGQTAPQIHCYSFLPEEGIERIIGLREKLRVRIKENAEVVGSDEVFFSGDPVNIADLYSEKAGIFDEADDEEVDLASYAYQIWQDAINAHPHLKSVIEELPNVVFSAKATDRHSDGVLLFARTKDGNDALEWLLANGKMVTQSHYTVLRTAECLYDTPSVVKLDHHHELVKQGLDMLKREITDAGGTLGRPNSVKHRTFTRLTNFMEEFDGTLMVQDNLRLALDQIFRYPLRERAIDTISRQLKLKVADYELANIVTNLYETDKLCIVTDTEDALPETKIICSMSLVGR